jgi:hypothetical protein
LSAITNNTIAPNSAVCLGIASPIIYGSTPTGGNGFYHYQWQKYISGSWVNLGLADTLIDYAPGLLSATSYFRRVVSSAQCSGTYSLISNIDTCTIYPLPTVNAGTNYSKCSNQAKYYLGGTPTGGTWSGSFVSFDSINNTLTEIVAEEEDNRNKIRKDILTEMDKLSPTKDGEKIQELLINMNRQLTFSYEKEIYLREFIDKFK